MFDFGVSYQSDLSGRADAGFFVHYVGVKRNPSIRKRPMHLHPDYTEIAFFRKGSGTCVIGDQSLHFEDGDILIFNCNTLHEEYYLPSGEFEEYILAVSGFRMPGLAKNELIASSLEPLLHPKQRQTMIDTIFRLLIQEAILVSKKNSDICKYLAQTLIAVIQELIDDSPKVQKTRKLKLGMQIANYINCHFYEDNSLEKISDYFHVSRYYAAHAFKDELGTSINRYITNRRIGEAQTLLMYTTLTIGQISEKIGYNDQNYFNVVFRKQLGCSPSAFRQQFIDQQTSPF